MSETFAGLDCWLGADSEGSVLTLLTSLDLNRHRLGFDQAFGEKERLLAGHNRRAVVSWTGICRAHPR